MVPSGASFFCAWGASAFFSSAEGWAPIGVEGELAVEVLPNGAGCFIAEGTVKGVCNAVVDGIS